MESFIQDLRIDGKTVEWEDRTVKLLQSKGITSIAQLFDAAQINVTPTLENKFNVGYGMSLNMNVYFLFDLIRDIGSIDRLCAPVAGPENYSHVLTFGQKIVIKRYFRTLCSETAPPSPNPNQQNPNQPPHQTSNQQQNYQNQ